MNILNGSIHFWNDEPNDPLAEDEGRQRPQKSEEIPLIPSQPAALQKHFDADPQQLEISLAPQDRRK
ncbi:MAG: hypothetical protein U1F76_08840 [Candidatus Competibacteraceae bacterium]